MEVPPGQSFDYQCELKILEPGDFQAQMEIYLEDNGIRLVTLTVRGQALAPEAAHHATP